MTANWKHVRLLVFDLDGTLVDSKQDLALSRRGDVEVLGVLSGEPLQRLYQEGDIFVFRTGHQIRLFPVVHVEHVAPVPCQKQRNRRLQTFSQRTIPLTGVIMLGAGGGCKVFLKFFRDGLIDQPSAVMRHWRQSRSAQAASLDSEFGNPTPNGKPVHDTPVRARVL